MADPEGNGTSARPDLETEKVGEDSRLDQGEGLGVRAGLELQAHCAGPQEGGSEGEGRKAREKPHSPTSFSQGRPHKRWKALIN